MFGPATKFPYAASSTYRPVDAPAETLYRRHQHLGLAKAVIVQASCHGTDNRAMLDAIAIRPDSYRGIAVVADDISAAEIETLHVQGVRGVRFNFVKRLGGRTPDERQQRIINAIRPFGWHVVVYFDSEDIESLTPFLNAIDLPVVIDHMGRVPIEQGTSSPAFAMLSRLLEDDKYWVKISCPERLSKTGPPYTDVEPVAGALLEQVPHRVLWGSDWPHPNMKSHMPDDGLLVDRIVSLCKTVESGQDFEKTTSGTTLLQTVLVDNPSRLYWNDE